MSRRARPLVVAALVLAVGCGPGDSDPAADSQIDPAAVQPVAPPRPWARGQGPGPDPRCTALEDITVAHHQPPVRKPAAQVTPNCSLVDPAPFVAPHQPTRHYGTV